MKLLSPRSVYPDCNLPSIMLFRTQSAAVYGIDADPVDVEVDLSPAPNEGENAPTVTIVGLPDAAVRESRERIRAAINNSNFFFPFNKIIINLAPADVRKEGASFDLPIALGILGANGDLDDVITPSSFSASQRKRQAAVNESDIGRSAQAATRGDALEDLREFMIVGELSLDGSVRAIKGALSIALRARAAGVKYLLLPEENAREAAVVAGVEVFAVNSLRTAVGIIAKLRRGVALEAIKIDVDELLNQHDESAVDFAEVRGQLAAKRALEIACAGGHNILLIGPPGSGKTMLAKRLPSILPPLEFEAALELTKIHSVAGLTSGKGLVRVRPYRAPHHTISDAGLIGGGAVPRPGEVSLAHHGVLFLDELPEFDRSVLEVLRQPLEDKQVTISRAAMALTFPSSFMLVAAMNPCPCGNFNNPQVECRCTPLQIDRYVGRISGPLLDRIDIHIDVPAVRFQDLRAKNSPAGESSAAIRARVVAARERQRARLSDKKIYANAQMTTREIHAFCQLDETAEKMLESAMRRMGLSARAHDRILKVSRTIADLAASEHIQPQHLSEAVNYRSLDRTYWN